MTISNDNPYAPPETVGFGLPAEKNSLRWIVAQFHTECRALSGAAVFFGMLAGLISFMLRKAPPAPKNELFFTLCAGLSVLLVVVGISILLKKMWAVGVFLLFNWPMALLTILTVFSGGSFVPGTVLFAIFFAVTFALAAAQCHRVLKWSRRIEAAGYPLSVRSDDVLDGSI
jgi:hypothetical protein